jgi:hypothetical protein
LWIGHSALKAIIGTMLLPHLGDRLLAREGYSGQMSHEPARSRDDNLFDPVPGDPGAHGRFDGCAQDDVVGFDPAWLRAGAALALFATVAGAFLFGRASAPPSSRVARSEGHIT